MALFHRNSRNIENTTGKKGGDLRHTGSFPIGHPLERGPPTNTYHPASRHSEVAYVCLNLILFIFLKLLFALKYPIQISRNNVQNLRTLREIYRTDIMFEQKITLSESFISEWHCRVVGLRDKEIRNVAKLMKVIPKSQRLKPFIKLYDFNKSKLNTSNSSRKFQIDTCEMPCSMVRD